MKILTITQARSGSSRLPNKVLKKVNGKTLLGIHIQRAKKSKLSNEFIVATTDKNNDDELAEKVKSLEVKCYRGSENDVLDRFYQAAKRETPDYVVRLTSDCPLIDPNIIDAVIVHSLVNDLDYCSNVLSASFPDGMDVEVFKFSALKKAWEKAKLSSEREHVTPYIWKNSSYKGGSLFTSDNYSSLHCFEQIRLTVDEQKDFEVIESIINQLGDDKDWLTYSNYYIDSPLKEVNSNIKRNEGYGKSINEEKNG